MTMRAPMDRASIHPDATVANARVGAGSKIWQHASVIRGAVIGEDCSVGAGATIDGALIGDRCLIQSGARIYAGTVIGSDVFVGPNSVFCNDMWPECDKAGFDPDLFAKGKRAILVGNRAVICAGVQIVPGVCIGHGAMVAAGCRVERNVPDNMILRPGGYLSEIPADRRERRMRFAIPDARTLVEANA